MNLRSLFAAIPLALVLGAAAQAAKSPLDALFACQEIRDDTARLACLDREVAALHGESKRQEVVAVDREQLEKDSYGLNSSSVPLPKSEAKKDVVAGEPAGSSATPAGAPAEPAGASAGPAGSSAKPVESSAEPRIVRDKHGRIEGLEKLAVARFSKTPYGKLVVKLQNGQVWTQSDTIRIFIPLGTAQEEMTVSIRNAALGSHQMQLNGDGPWFRVYREK